MKTKIATSFGLALMLAMGILATMLALGMFTASKVSAGGGVAPTQDVSPPEAGTLSEYRFTFTVTGSMLAGTGEIRITFDKDTVMPATISRSNVLIKASRLTNNAPSGLTNVTGAGQVVPLDTDPVIETLAADPRRKTVIIKVPDMNPSTTDPGTGVQGIGVGYGTAASPTDVNGVAITSTVGQNELLVPFSQVTVIFTTAAGIRTPNEAEVSKANVVARDTTLFPNSTNLVTGAAAAAAATGDISTNIKRTLKANLIDGERGSSLTLTGRGFKGGQTATVWRDANFDGTIDSGEIELGKFLIDADGSFNATVTINNPPFVAGKGTGTNVNRINALDGRGQTLCPSGNACASVGTADNVVGNVADDLPLFELKGSVRITPTTAAVGDTIQVTLKDWPANTAPVDADLANMNLGGVKLFTTVALAAVAQTTGGEKTFEVKVPNGVETGTQTLTMNFAGSGSRRATMTVSGAVLTLTPSEVVPNQTVTIIGRGFSTGGAATINKALDTSVVSIGGSTTDLKASGGAASTKIAETGTVTVDNGGNWSAALVVPVNSTTTTQGTFELKVIDSAGRDGSINMVFPTRTLVLTPVSSRLGTTVTFTGTGYPADNTKSGAAATPAVSIKYSVAGTTRIVTTVTPDSSGRISGAFTVPLDAGIPSTNAVRAEYTFGDPATTVTTTASHDVPRAELTISPNSGPPGTSAIVTGKGYKAFTNVSELKLGDIDVRPAPAPSTDASGNYSTSILVPQLNLGVQTVNSKVGDTVASTSFTVTVAPVAPPPPPAPPPVVTVAPAAALAPLAANLVRVWGYDAPTQKFQLYDPAAAPLSDLTVLKRGGGYWINVKSAQKVTLGTFEYDLAAGWNNVGWQG